MPSTLLLLFGSSHFTNGRDVQSNWCFFLLSTGIMNPSHRTQTCDTSLNATHVPEFLTRKFFFPWCLEKDLKKTKTCKGNNFTVYIRVKLEMLDFWWHYYYNHLLLLLSLLLFLLHFLGQNVQSLNLFSYLWRCYLLTTYQNTKN